MLQTPKIRMQTRTAKVLRQIDEEIAALDSQLLALKIRRNSLVPFGRLPWEILVRVLHFAQVGIKPGPSRFETPWINFDRKWVEYTLVCRRLREVALGTPVLWTFIECDPRNEPGRWENLCITRAKDCHLDILVRDDDNSKDSHSLITFASAYLEKARRIYLGRSRTTRSYPTHQCLFQPLLHAQLPVIEDLRCTVTY
jgi:hypothetical protein